MQLWALEVLRGSDDEVWYSEAVGLVLFIRRTQVQWMGASQSGTRDASAKARLEMVIASAPIVSGWVMPPSLDSKLASHVSLTQTFCLQCIFLFVFV